MKKLSALLLAAVMLLSLVACSDETSEPEVTTVTYAETSATEATDIAKTKIDTSDDTSGMGFMKVITDRDYGFDVNYHQDVSEITDFLLKGETDIASIPVTTAAKLIGENPGMFSIISADAVCSLFVIETGETVESLSDLKGKTVYVPGKETNIEYMVRTILEKNGINPDTDLTLELMSTTAEVASKAVDGSAGISIIPEPYAAKVLSATEGSRRAISLSDEWGKISEVKPLMNCTVVRNEYLEQNPDRVNELIEFNEISINYLLTNKLAAQYLTETGYFTDEEIASDCLQYSGLCFLTGEELKTAVNEILAELSGYSGEAPADDCFYEVAD